MWDYILLTLLTAVLNYVLMPKPKSEKPERGQPELPFTEEGTEIPVVFGCIEVRPFIGWYGHFRTKNIYESPDSKGK